jgi:hypothetical protein
MVYFFVAFPIGIEEPFSEFLNIFLFLNKIHSITRTMIYQFELIKYNEKLILFVMLFSTSTNLTNLK